MKISNDIVFNPNIWIHIQLKKNRIQIGGKGVETMILNMVLHLKKKNTHRFGKTFFHVSLFGNGLNKFYFENVEVMTMSYEI
jgi:hypothetical protein